MAATNGTVIGVFQGASLAAAFTNPQQLDIIQVINIGGTVVYNLDKTGVNHTNPVAPSLVHGNPQALYQQNGSSSLAAAFPGNQITQLDLLQVISGVGGTLIFHVDYLGVAHTP